MSYWFATELVFFLICFVNFLSFTSQRAQCEGLLTNWYIRHEFALSVSQKSRLPIKQQDISNDHKFGNSDRKSSALITNIIIWLT